MESGWSVVDRTPNLGNVPALRVTYTFNPGIVLARTEEAWAMATVEVAALAREKAPYSESPGRSGPHLRNTIFARVRGALRSILWAASAHARMIEFGRGPVRPVKAKVLRWIGPDGEPIFSTYSGPAPAQPFLRPAAAAFPMLLKRAMASTFRKIA